MGIKKSRADPHHGCLWVFFYRRNYTVVDNNIDLLELKFLPDNRLA
jgi:hypothetical protein